MLVILDTNVLVSAIRSKQGASYQILSRIGTGAFAVAVSVPLVLEYEATMLKHIRSTPLTKQDVAAVVDYICLVARRQPIFFLWRPLLGDTNDDMIAEVAIAAGCDAIVTHNRTHFEKLTEFGCRVLSPAEFLAEIEQEQT